MSITQKLTDQIRAKAFTEQDLSRAALILLDWTGCAIAGRSEPFGQKLTDTFKAPAGPCTRIGASPAALQMAAFHNGCLGNILEMDDVDKRAVLHAAPTVIPAALAMHEHVGASSEAMLRAIIIGYDVTIRIGRAVGPGHYAYWHNTATCGPFGAAAAACYLLGGSDMTAALGLAGTQAAGLWQTRHEPDSDAKQIHAGNAAQIGVMAAMMSAQGIKGPREILEGPQGFFAAMCPGANPEDIFKDYGDEWLIHHTSIKPYAACRHAHAAIDAALMAELSSGDILIETYDDAIKFCDRAAPSPGREAKFSLQHCVAFTLMNGHAPGLNDFDVRALEKTSAIRQKITVKAADEFNAAYPSHYGAAVTSGGKRHVAKDALGDPERPLSKDDILDKALRLYEHAGHSRAQAKTALNDFLSPHITQLLKLDS